MFGINYFRFNLQMVSLLKLAEITEEGVKFRSPYDDSESMLTPERSIEIQVRRLNEETGWNIQFFCSTTNLPFQT